MLLLLWGCRSRRDPPDLPFLAFLEFLAFSLVRNSLLLSVFPFFPKDFRGSLGKKNPCFFGGFPCFLPKKQGPLGSPLAIYRAQNPETPKSLQKSLPRGLWTPRTPKKVPKKVRKVQKKLILTIFWTFRTFLGTFWGSGGVPETSRETFLETFWGFGVLGSVEAGKTPKQGKEDRARTSGPVPNCRIPNILSPKNPFEAIFTSKTLSFHSLLFLFYQGKPSNLPRIFSHCWTHKILGKDRENSNSKQGNSLLRINQGNSKNQGMEGQGSSFYFSGLFLNSGPNKLGVALPHLPGEIVRTIFSQFQSILVDSYFVLSQF